MRVRSPGREDPLEEGTAIHSSVPAWRIPWTEEPGGLQPIGLQRIRHDRKNLTHTHTHFKLHSVLQHKRRLCLGKEETREGSLAEVSP